MRSHLCQEFMGKQELKSTDRDFPTYYCRETKAILIISTKASPKVFKLWNIGGTRSTQPFPQAQQTPTHRGKG